MSLPTWEVDCRTGEQKEGETTIEELRPGGVRPDPIDELLLEYESKKKLLEEHPLMGASLQQVDKWMSNHIDVDSISDLQSAKFVIGELKEALKETIEGVILLRRILVKVVNDD